MLSEASEKRPCCLKLRMLSRDLSLLKDPQTVRNAIETLSQHCTLMKLFGQSKIKWDLAKSDCQLAVFPIESQILIDECGKTRAVNPELSSYDNLLAFLNGALAHNANLQQIDDKRQILLSVLREGEKRFGRVPETSLLKDQNRHAHGLEASDVLKAHPLLEKTPQFDGIPPHTNPNPQQNPDAAQNAEELQNQLKYTPAPSPAPTTPRPKPL